MRIKISVPRFWPLTGNSLFNRMVMVNFTRKLYKQYNPFRFPAGENSLGGDNIDDSGGEGSDRSNPMLREQDRFLPIANVARIMKKTIPTTGKVCLYLATMCYCTHYFNFQIAKDARECVQECVSEFISFITSEASERCHQEKRKTINGEDILFAMTTLGFDNYVEPLKIYLQKYRESIKGERTAGGEGFESAEESSYSSNVITDVIIPSH